ncbi:MAG: WecB/TagA/CpsF family glycosyltransferase [Chloroflexi bacterium]|nr:MAG: WecB/TagA/CpsF family glycosyltransferase [Chloroflexota bacterium]TME90300.1 MAG: WecB/TagA/CpsF family glycosyltransferase [Chloroflexota bacterium]
MSARVDVLGVGFDRVHLAAATEQVLRRLDADERTFVITANPEFVMLARRDESVAQIAREAQLVVADGSGVVAASRLLGDPLPRVPGRLLVDALVPHLAQRRSPIFFLGAAPGVAERAAAELRRRARGLVVAGVHAGSAEPDDDAVSVARIRDSGARVLFVAYGMPKQERWIARNLAALPAVRLAVGVGGVFDQLAGVQKVPPAIFHAIGLEWLWRLVREPRRWRRQRVLPVFALLVLRRRLLGR